MKHIFFIGFALQLIMVQAQNPSSRKEVVDKIAIDICDCIENVNVLNKNTQDIHKDASLCIQDYILFLKLAEEKEGVGKPSNTTTNETYPKADSIKKNGLRNLNPPTTDILYFNELEASILTNCPIYSEKLSIENSIKPNTISSNEEAVELYNKALDQFDRRNYSKTIHYIKQALKIDEFFSNAWDLLGASYYEEKDYKSAIEAYNKSLEINPSGIEPLKNLSIIYKKIRSFDVSLDFYLKYDTAEPNNPDTKYAIATMYFFNKNNIPKGLEYLCDSYILYKKNNSTYTSDAKRLLQTAYSQLDGDKNLQVFNSILASHSITLEEIEIDPKKRK